MDGFDFTAAPAPAEAVAPLDGFDFTAPAAPAAEEPAAPAEAEAEAPAAGGLDMMAGFQTEEVAAEVGPDRAAYAVLCFLPVDFCVAERVRCWVDSRPPNQRRLR